MDQGSPQQGQADTASTHTTPTKARPSDAKRSRLTPADDGKSSSGAGPSSMQKALSGLQRLYSPSRSPKAGRTPGSARKSMSRMSRANSTVQKALSPDGLSKALKENEIIKSSHGTPRSTAAGATCAQGVAALTLQAHLDAEAMECDHPGWNGGLQDTEAGKGDGMGDMDAMEIDSSRKDKMASSAAAATGAADTVAAGGGLPSAAGVQGSRPLTAQLNQSVSATGAGARRSLFMEAAAVNGTQEQGATAVAAGFSAAGDGVVQNDRQDPAAAEGDSVAVPPAPAAAAPPAAADDGDDDTDEDEVDNDDDDDKEDEDDENETSFFMYLGRLGTLLARQNLAIQYMKKKGGVLKLVGINGQVVDGELGEEVECVGFSASKLHSFLSDCGKLAQKDCSGRSGRKRAVCLADAALQLLKKFK